jgi:hypothetical protein
MAGFLVLQKERRKPAASEAGALKKVGKSRETGSVFTHRNCPPQRSVC